MNSDVIVGLFSLVFCIAYTIAAWLLPDAAIGNPMAPKYFPLGVGIMGAVFSLMLLSRGMKRGRVARKGKAPDPGYWVLIAGLCACCLVYAAVLERIGFLISTTVFLAAMLFLVNGVKGWIANIAVSLVFTVGIWYAFTKIFLFTLP
ncbi:tripartite tricarboxylate transporter TctB family protein [Cloacibacillus sp. An23]|uniref:tripartite tricarboxylate transporter TctB family protein n=1 Tax=Cloacibacillus sp. An23 TaxID=1965591 RepID=UPI0013023BAB|nr:tripartite tricarboxylate transporter TctB family protein [Cloacibacillus sp. An23]